MIRNRLIVGMAALLGLAACQAATETPAAGPQPAAPAPAPAPAPAADPAPAPPAPAAQGFTPEFRNLTDGIYTMTQAERGLEIFEMQCKNCHDIEVWQEGRFRGLWHGRPVLQLYTYVHNTMPYDNPRSLSSQQTVDVLSYIFSLNQVPVGDGELPPDEEQLYAITIDWDVSF